MVESCQVSTGEKRTRNCETSQGEVDGKVSRHSFCSFHKAGTSHSIAFGISQWKLRYPALHTSNLLHGLRVTNEWGKRSGKYITVNTSGSHMRTRAAVDQIAISAAKRSRARDRSLKPRSKQMKNASDTGNEPAGSRASEQKYPALPKSAQQPGHVATTPRKQRFKGTPTSDSRFAVRRRLVVKTPPTDQACRFLRSRFYRQAWRKQHEVRGKSSSGNRRRIAPGDCSLNYVTRVPSRKDRSSDSHTKQATWQWSCHENGSVHHRNEGSQLRRRAQGKKEKKLRADKRPFTSSAIAQVATAAHKAWIPRNPKKRKQANKQERYLQKASRAKRSTITIVELPATCSLQALAEGRSGTEAASTALHFILRVIIVLRTLTS